MFERPITFRHGHGNSSSAGRIDLYRRGPFVLESKKIKAASHTKDFYDRYRVPAARRGLRVPASRQLTTKNM